MSKKITINKDFLNLLKGDIISITTNCDNQIHFNIENRTQKVRFYGNEKGRWGINNPYRKEYAEFILIDEPVPYKPILTFNYIPFPEPHPINNLRFADNSKTLEDWINKIINDLKVIGVINN